MGSIHRRLFDIIIILLFSTPLIGQSTISNQLDAAEKQSINLETLHQSTFSGYAYAHITFDALPNNAVILKMQQAGIELLSYKNENQYLAKISSQVNQITLSKYSINHIQKVNLKSKLSDNLQKLSVTEKDSASGLDVVVILNTPFKEEEWLIFNATYQAKIIRSYNKATSIVQLQINPDAILNIASHPNVRWVEEVAPEVQRLNYENTQTQRTNVLASHAIGGRALTGKNVIIGVGDGGELGNHIDLNCRTINQANGTYSSYGAHGDHVAGSIAGAGNLIPESKGMAPEAELIIQKTTDIIYETEQYIQEYGMSITNNSYGVGADCETNGSYNYSSINLDRQLNEYPHLIHLFAAGNSGNDSCGDYPTGYGTVLRYYGSAKNVLTVGAIDSERKIANMSSRGPAMDGRIKPEICAPGVNVQSMGRDFNYFEISGTSMATPSVAGSIALLYERYKQIHNDNNPNGALIKAISCNTADDLGTAGPDYQYGFGAFNALRAVETIEQEQYISDTIQHAVFNKYTVEVPEGLAQAKFLLYWHDLAAEMDAAQTLVNDLDIKITDANGVIYRPWTLNPDPNEVMKPAVRAIDHLNNIEQVTIDFPASGTYEIQIRGFQIPMGTQSYHVTYDFVQTETRLTFPFGKEQWQPNKKEGIQWDAPSNNTSLFELEYSLNNGATWLLIDQNIAADKRQYLWNIPNVWTENGRIRIRKMEESTYVSHEEAFQILPTPQNLVVKSPCTNHIQLTWEAASMATSYEVYVLNCDAMESIAITTDTCINVLYEMDSEQEYWFSVRSITANNKESQRTNAVSCVPSILPDCGEINTDHNEIEIDSTSTNNPSTSIEETTNFSAKEPKTWTVSPNPFEQSFTLNTIKTLSQFSSIRLHSTMGQECTEQATITQSGAKTFSIQIDPQLTSGVYYLTIIEKTNSYIIPVIKL